MFLVLICQLVDKVNTKTNPFLKNHRTPTMVAIDTTMAQQIHSNPDALVSPPNCPPPADSDFALSLKNQSMEESFKESNYNTILSGRSLDPVHFQFSDQKAISIQLEKLSLMNHEKFVELEADLSEAHRQYSVRCDHRRLLSLLKLWTGVETLLETIQCPNDHVEKCALEWNLPAKQVIFYWLPRLKNMHKVIAEDIDLGRSSHWKELGDACHTLEQAFYYRFWSEDVVGRRAYLPDGSRSNSSDTMDLAYLKAVYNQLLRGMETVTSKLDEEISEIHGKIGAKRIEVMGLRKEELRCTAGSQFAETLSILNSPFNFCGLPREIRNKIYNQILTFSYNITAVKNRNVNALEKTKRMDNYRPFSSFAKPSMVPSTLRDKLCHSYRSLSGVWPVKLFRSSFP